jgi:hypothetical protein
VHPSAYRAYEHFFERADGVGQNEDRGLPPSWATPLSLASGVGGGWWMEVDGGLAAAARAHESQ